MAMIQNSSLEVDGFWMGSALKSTELEFGSDGNLYISVKLRIHPLNKDMAISCYNGVRKQCRADVKLSRIETNDK